MSLLIEGRAGKSTLADGVDGKVRLGNQGEILTGSMNGTFYEQVMRGHGYVFTTALAGNALVAATTTNAPAIMNPAGSGRLLVLQKVTFGRTAVGTPLEGSIVYLRTQNVNSIVGTGADIISGTKVAAVNLRSDLSDDSRMLFYPTTISTTLTPALWACSGVAQTADDGATTVSGPRAELLVDNIDGMLVVGPGTLFSIGAAVSLNSTYTISIYALSLPLPS